MHNQNEVSIHPHAGAVTVGAGDATAEAGVKRLRTIVADDSSTFIEVVCALLEWHGKVEIVTRVPDDIATLEAVAKLRPELVLMGIEMPSLDGLNAC